MKASLKMFLIFALPAVFMPFSALAVSSALSIDLSDGNPPSSSAFWVYYENVYTITANTPDFEIFIKNSNNGSDRRVAVAPGITAKLALENAVINGLEVGHSPLVLMGDSDVTLRLVDDSVNTFTANGNAGIYTAQAGAKLTISGNGELIATGSGRGAGIGDSYPTSGNPGYGSISITGGAKVTAVGAYTAAGIGGTLEGGGGNISISGGTVKATGGMNGAGIGGGLRSNSGNIAISGGTVTAEGVSTYQGVAADIGRGVQGQGGSVTITGGSVNCVNPSISCIIPAPKDDQGKYVYLNTLTPSPSVGAGKRVSASYIGLKDDYGLNFTQTDADGKLYFWLIPSKSEHFTLTIDGNHYSNTFARLADYTNSNILYLNQNPPFTVAVNNISYDAVSAQYVVSVAEVGPPVFHAVYGTIVLAFYEPPQSGGKLLLAQFANAGGQQSGSSYTFTNNISLPPAAKIKAYILDNPQNIKPLCESKQTQFTISP